MASSSHNLGPASFRVSSYSNSRHTYSFPRISGFLFDGSQSYDFGNDGDGQTIGACSVSHRPLLIPPFLELTLTKANVRRTNVATKLKVTYIKGQLLDVKAQYKACEPKSVVSQFRVAQLLERQGMSGRTALASRILHCPTTHSLVSVR
jgi:hypothetical protein